jgi:hypothetical protein
MGRSLAPVAGAAPAEERAADRSFEAEGFRYSVERDGDRLVHRQTCPGPAGQPLTDVRAEVAYVIGSGERARSYVISRDGFLFQSPISWYARTGKFDLSPGYRGNRVGFERVIGPDCLFCHGNGVAHAADTVNGYDPPVFHGHAVGCERCHGPGELHAAGGRPPPGAPDHTIVNPGRLEGELREAVCEQCHLQGAARVLRPGRDWFDFRPGLPLDLFLTVFARPPEAGPEQQFVGHVAEMYQSRCYQQTQGAGKLGCVSCHDPHRVPAADEKVTFFRQRCLQCHAEAGCRLPAVRRKEQSPADDCVACHMPRRPSSDIAHVATTDHRVIRLPDGAAGRNRPPREARTGELPLAYFRPGSPVPESTRDLGLALVGLVREPVPARRRLAELALPLLDEAMQKPDDLRAWEGRGQALRSLDRTAEALACAEFVLDRAPRREVALADAADAADALSQREKAVGYWDRAVAVNPWRVNYRFRRAQLWSEAGDWGRAMAECDAILHIDPNMVEARLLRSAYLLEAGDPRAARAEFDTVMALHPRQPDDVRRWFEQKARTAGRHP